MIALRFTFVVPFEKRSCCTELRSVLQLKVKRDARKGSNMIIPNCFSIHLTILRMCLRTNVCAVSRLVFTNVLANSG